MLSCEKNIRFALVKKHVICTVSVGSNEGLPFPGRGLRARIRGLDEIDKSCTVTAIY